MGGGVGKGPTTDEDVKRYLRTDPEPWTLPGVQAYLTDFGLALKLADGAWIVSRNGMWGVEARVLSFAGSGVAAFLRALEWTEHWVGRPMTFRTLGLNASSTRGRRAK